MPDGTNPAISEDLRLGELLVELGLVDRKKLDSALQIVDQTGLALGRVLVLSQYIREPILDSAIRCQTYIKSNSVDPNLAKRALVAVATGEHPSLEEALGKIGVVRAEDQSNAKLGELLIESGLISQPQLDKALQQAEETGLPFGRSLVLSGMISEAGLTATLNAQSLLRNGRVTREQAIKSLRSSARRNTTSGSQPSERDFYGLPDRRTVLLGELLIAAGTITKPQLSNAIEVSVGSGKLLGQVLVDSHYCTPALLENALQLQELILANRCSQQDATRVMFLMDREGLPLEQAIQKVRMNEIGGNKRVPFPEFLKLLGLVTENDIEKSLQLGRSNPQLMLQMLSMAEVCDSNQLHLAAKINSLMEAGRMTAEHAFILFDYARKKQVNVTQAMKELNWSQKDLMEDTGPQRIVQPNAEVEWEQARNLAEQAFQDGRFADAERLWIDVIRKSEKFGRESQRFVGSIERLADVYCRLGHIDRAESLYNDALVIKTRVLPPSSLHIASTVNNLAKVNYFQGKYDQAENFATRYLSLYKANFPPDHPDVACALQNMATLYHMQNKFEQSEPYYVEALDICKKQLGEQHPTTVRMQQNYARLLQSLRRYQELKRMDVMASGNVTGSWKAVSVSEEHSLYGLSDRLNDD